MNILFFLSPKQVDDRGIFIGIVRRQAIIRYCYDKTRAEQHEEKHILEYAAAH